MKIIIITFALCAVAVLAYDVQNIQDLIARLDPDFELQARECINEMKLDSRMMDSEHFREAQLPSVEVQNCFIACLDKKIGLVKSDGSYNDSFVVLADDPPEMQQKMKNNFDTRIKLCRDAVGTDNCKMSSCFHKMPKNFWQ